MEKDQILSEESAREQLQILLDFYDQDLEDLDDEDSKVSIRISKKLTKAFMQGKLEVEIDDTGIKVRQNLCDGSSLVYRTIDAQAKVAMEQYKKPHERLYGLLAVLSKSPMAKVQKIKGVDLSIAEHLALIFLAP